MKVQGYAYGNPWIYSCSFPFLIFCWSLRKNWVIFHSVSHYFSSFLLRTHGLSLFKWENISLFWIKQDISNGLGCSSSKQEVRKPLKHIIQSLKPHSNTSHVRIYPNKCMHLHAGASNICTRTCTQMTIHAGHISYSKWIIWNILNIHNPWYYAINLCPESDTTTHHFTGANPKQIIRGGGRETHDLCVKTSPLRFPLQLIKE